MTLSTGRRTAHFKCTQPTDARLKPIGDWLPENRSLLADFCVWLCAGGYGKSTIHLYGLSARLALAFLDQPGLQIDIQRDLERVRKYLATRPLSATTRTGYHKGLNKLAHYLRQRQGLPEPEKTVNWAGYLRELPDGLVTTVRVYVEHRSRAWQADNRVQLTRTLLARLGGFLRFSKSGSLLEITPKRWFAWLEAHLKMGGKTSSQNSLLWTLQSFLRFQQEAGQPICERMLAVRPQKTGKSLPRDLPVPEVKALLKAATLPQDRAWLLIMVQTGLRTCEIRRLKWAAVDFEHRSLRIEQSKGQQDRVVFLSPTAIEALKGLPRSAEFVFTRYYRPLSRRYCQSRLTSLGKTCAVKASPHQLRHTAATLLLNSGMSVWGVQAILGHKSVQTTLGYVRTYDNTVAKEYQAAIDKQKNSLPPRSLETGEPIPTRF